MSSNSWVRMSVVSWRLFGRDGDVGDKAAFSLLEERKSGGGEGGRGGPASFGDGSFATAESPDASATCEAELLESPAAVKAVSGAANPRSLAGSAGGALLGDGMTTGSLSTLEPPSSLNISVSSDAGATGVGCRKVGSSGELAGTEAVWMDSSIRWSMITETMPLATCALAAGLEMSTVAPLPEVPSEASSRLTSDAATSFRMARSASAPAAVPTPLPARRSSAAVEDEDEDAA
mmetsp:Transcript_62753/g.111479  ORF Transcript_62753/g.111479 Transcript_62753/m.111479 type:complete len:234 (-) Transcript_62753:2217-2918(-)